MIVQTYERSDAWTSAAQFLQWFSVDPSRFLLRKSDSTAWQTVNSRLGHARVERVLQSRGTAGFFSRQWTSSLILDVDLHRAPAPWTINSSHLFRARDLLIRVFGVPSLYARTPRGLHMIYFLSEKRQATTLREWAAAQARQLDLGLCTLDIAPCHRRGIRIPALANCTTGDLETLGEATMRIYTAPDLRRQANHRGGGARRKAKLRESEIDLDGLAFRVGGSNQPYLHAITGLYRQGFSEEEASANLKKKFANDGYSGDLSNKSELERRVASSYQNFRRLNINISRKSQRNNSENAEIPEWILRAAMRSPFPQAQKERFVRFVSMLSSWQAFLLKEHRGDGTAYQQRCQMYPGHHRRSASGAIPLPSVLMRKEYQRYGNFITYLQEANYLRKVFPERRPFSIDTELAETIPGLCRYFVFEPATISSQGEPELYNIILVRATPVLLCELKRQHRARRPSVLRAKVLASLAKGVAIEDCIEEATGVTKKQIALLCSRDPDLRRTQVKNAEGKLVNVIHERRIDLAAEGFKVYRSGSKIVARGISDALLALRDELEPGETPTEARLRAMTEVILALESGAPALKRQFSTLFRRNREKQNHA